VFNLKSTAAVVACRGTGEASCVVMIPLSAARVAELEAAG
jgi:hypothetical protein